MALQHYIVDFPRLSTEELEQWKTIPSSVISDTLNRCHSMDFRIKPVAPGMTLCGQAMTVVPMPGDNGMLLHAVSIAGPGDVVVVAGGGLENVAMAGEWVVRCCRRRGLAGLVIDGSVRDVRELRALGFPVFAKGAVPRGPHKNFGGRMGVTASVGNTPVNPGDLVVGDDDGIVVVPLHRASETLKASLVLLEKERLWAAQIEEGRTLVEVLNVPPLDMVDRERVDG